MSRQNRSKEQKHSPHGVAHLDGEFVGLRLYDRLLEK
jgi:hypothetical protein